MHWYFKALRRFADFKGRSRRREFVVFFLANGLILFALMWSSSITDMVPHRTARMSALIFSGCLLIPSLALAARRLHDIDQTMHFLIAIFTPMGIYLLGVMLLLEGDRDKNRYGADPKAGSDVPPAPPG